MKFVKKYSTVYSYILVYTVIYHVQTCIYSAKPRYTELSQSIEINTSHTWIYLDILVYSEIYRNRKGIYSDIRGITQYITIGKINIMFGLEPSTLCILQSSSHHCTTSVDTLSTFECYKITS